MIEIGGHPFRRVVTQYAIDRKSRRDVIRVRCRHVVGFVAPHTGRRCPGKSAGVTAVARRLNM